MIISPSLLRNIALSAGIAAGISTANAEDKPAPADQRSAAKPAATAKLSPEARAVFLRHDTDKDGKLSMEEFDKAFAELQGEPKLAPPQQPRPIDPCPGCGMG